MDDYIRFGACNEVLKPQSARESLIEILEKGNVNFSVNSSFEDLCKMIEEYRCVVTEKCSEDRKYRVKCGSGQEECLDIVDLYGKITKDPSYKKKFSDLTVKQIVKAHRDFAMMSSGKQTPCYIKSGYQGMCSSDSKCKFHTRSGIFSIFGDYSHDHKECYLPDDYIKSVNTDTAPTELLKTIVMDIYKSSFLKMIASQKTNTLISSFVQADTLIRMVNEMENGVNRFTRGETIDAVENYIKDLKANRSIGESLESINGFLKSMASLQIEKETVIKLIKNITAGKVQINETSVSIATFLINLFLFCYEWFLADWIIWLIVFPAGRKYLSELMKDPVAAVAFLISISLSVDHVAPVVSTVLESAKSFGIVVPTDINNLLNNIVVTGISIPLRKLKSNSFTDKVQESVIKNEFQIGNVIKTINETVSVIM